MEERRRSGSKSDGEVEAEAEAGVGTARGERRKRDSVEERRRRRRKQFKELAFDWSFTSQDFKEMDLTRVDGGLPDKAVAREDRTEEEDGGEADLLEGMPLPPEAAPSSSSSPERVPKLRLSKISGLKRCVLDSASKDGQVGADTLARLFASSEFARCAFDLMDLDGDGILDTSEVMERAGDAEGGKAGDAPFKERFAVLVESFSNGYDVLTPDIFEKIWQGKELDKFLVQAVKASNPEEVMGLYPVMEFIILFTNPRYISDILSANTNLPHGRWSLTQEGRR